MDEKNKINLLLNKIRPYIKSHGGDVELLYLKSNSVTLLIKGACASCSLAKLTYNKVVRDLIKEKFPKVEKVIIKTQKIKKMANQKEYIRQKEGSNISKVVVDRDLCIGVASCVAVAPTTFELDGENKAIVIDPNTTDDETLKQAAQSCPTKAILLFDKDGNQIQL